jgi:hypothetical protein
MDNAELIREAVAMCPTSASFTVSKFMVTCPPGEILDDCIPNCDASTNGDVLLLYHNGNDMRLLCEISSFLYSWVGAATLGGFLGHNVAAFVSAVISGAAGTYDLTLVDDADINTDLVVQPWQNVIITGDMSLVEAPSWGSGGFTVREDASLTLQYVALLGGGSDSGGSHLTVRAGGRLSVASSLLVPPAGSQGGWAQPILLPCDGAAANGICRGPHAGAAVVEKPSSVSLAVPLVCAFWTEDCVALPAGVTTEQRAAGVASGIPWNADPVCFLPADHLTVPDDPNLLTSTRQVGHVTMGTWVMPPTPRCDAAEGSGPSQDKTLTIGQGPFGLHQNGTSWYRLPAGSGLPTAPPGPGHCGTAYTGWLSGWPTGAEGLPERNYATPADGTLPPPVGSPPAAGVVCFDTGGANACSYPTHVQVVSCGAFTLWELPPAPSTGCYGYCLAPDRCATCAASGRCAAESWAGYPPGTTCVNDDSTADSWGGNHCSSGYDSDPNLCGQHDDNDFTAGTQCCACGGGLDFIPGHCTCTTGWAGELCTELLPPLLGLPTGVSREQHDRAITAGVHPAADSVCFTTAFLTVPDDPRLFTSAGQGAFSSSDNYDPSLPPMYRCDAAEGYISTSGQGHGHGPFGLRQGDTSWYRLPAGSGLPTAPPGHYHCGTAYTGWLSGWPTGAEGLPERNYATPADGTLPPPVGSPPAAGVACFDGHSGGSTSCDSPTPVQVVSCGAFTLWELPPAPSTSYHGYCLAPDRCASCAASGRCAAESWAGYPPGTTCVNDDRGESTYTCSSYFDSQPDKCGQLDDLGKALLADNFTAATQCCACGGAGREFTSGHCACAAGWDGALCDKQASGR